MATGVEIGYLRKFDVKREVKPLRKMEILLIPVPATPYRMPFLDRGNIGDDRLARLETDLGFVEKEYGWALTISFSLTLHTLVKKEAVSEKSYFAEKKIAVPH